MSCPPVPRKAIYVICPYDKDHNRDLAFLIDTPSSECVLSLILELWASVHYKYLRIHYSVQFKFSRGSLTVHSLDVPSGAGQLKMVAR